MSRCTSKDRGVRCEKDQEHEGPHTAYRVRVGVQNPEFHLWARDRLWGVFVWQGDGRYSPEAAAQVFRSEKIAQKNADKRGNPFVVREIT